MNILNKYINEFNSLFTNKAEDLTKDLLNYNGVNSISQFRQKLGNSVAQTNQFIVNFNFPTFLRESSLISLFGISDFSNEIGILCYQISSPTKKMKTESVNVYNNLNRMIPNGFSWDTVKVSFIETADRKIFKLFDTWINGINNPVTNCGQFYDDSVGEIRLNLLDKRGNEKGYIVFAEAMPISVSFNNLSWNSSNEMVSVEVEFSYIYPITKDYTISNAYNAIYDIENSDAFQFISNLLDKAPSAVTNEIKNFGKKAVDTVLNWF